ncbi:hypothetical protein ARZXY2_1482 [Arthrobacter sp. ZXY-2]|nr:hypothetical protein ARZXY2_1482 [Arthrobacter sp. ZXY-2]
MYEDMPMPPFLEEGDWIRDEQGRWKMAGDKNPDIEPLTDADLFDLKCSEMDAYNRYYR